MSQKGINLMRQTLVAKNLKEYNLMEEQVFQQIREEMHRIGKLNPQMTRVEAHIQAILGLTQEEQLPQIILNHNN